MKTVWELVEQAIAEDQAVYEAAGMPRPEPCEYCGDLIDPRIPMKRFFNRENHLFCSQSCRRAWRRRTYRG